MTVLYRHAFDGDGLEVREADNGRHYVTGRVVPFGIATDIVEPDETGMLVRYRERFLPGCIARQAATIGGGWNRVALKLGHSESFDRLVGCAVLLEELDDGVHGRFVLHRDANLDKIRSVLEDAYTGLSVEFHAKRTDVDGDLHSRAEVYIQGVAATPTPAYAGAVITSVREAVVDLDATPNLDRVRRELEELRAAVAASSA